MKDLLVAFFQCVLWLVWRRRVHHVQWSCKTEYEYAAGRFSLNDESQHRLQSWSSSYSQHTNGHIQHYKLGKYAIHWLNYIQNWLCFHICMLSQHIFDFFFPLLIEKSDNRTVFSIFCHRKTLPDIIKSKFILCVIGFFDDIFTPTVSSMLPHVARGPFVSGIKVPSHNTTLRSVSLANRRRANELVAPPTIDDGDFGTGLKKCIYWWVPCLGKSF